MKILQWYNELKLGKALKKNHLLGYEIVRQIHYRGLKNLPVNDSLIIKHIQWTGHFSLKTISETVTCLKLRQVIEQDSEGYYTLRSKTGLSNNNININTNKKRKQNTTPVCGNDLQHVVTLSNGTPSIQPDPSGVVMLSDEEVDKYMEEHKDEFHQALIEINTRAKSLLRENK